MTSELNIEGALAIGDVLRLFGRLGAARLGFTDATLTTGGRVAFLACAEDSPDAARDGAVLGCRFGLIDGMDRATEPALLGQLHVSGPDS